MKKITLLLSLLIISISSCKKENSTQQPTTTEDDTFTTENKISTIDSLEIQRKQDSIAELEKNRKEAEKQSEKYSVYIGEAYDYWPMKNSDSLRKKFFDTFSEEQRYTIAALNRIDVKHLKSKDTLIVPHEIRKDFLSYSPFPHHVEMLSEIPKIAIFSYPIQAFALYENGKLIKWGPTNMGKKSTQTPRGLFFTNWKGRRVKSTSNSEWILNWNFNISNLEGVGWHQYELPGYPASHSCLRLLDADAKMMYNWANQWVLENKKEKAKGTPVIVYGDYNFGKKGIWHQLPKNPNITTVSLSDLESKIQPHLNEIIKQQKHRADYLAQKNTTTTTDSVFVKKDTLTKN